MNPIRTLDLDALRDAFQNAEPFPHIVIENFLDPGFAREVAAAYPSFEEGSEQGFAFDFVRERRKIQVSDSGLFPTPVARLHEALAAPEFLAQLETITGIPSLEADPSLGGGGIHVTGPGGRLDVHVDFNFNEERNVHRRLNILVYLNPEWEESWGGAVELWDARVKRCIQRVPPVLNQCVLFETSAISFHGVEPVAPIAPVPRQSFAAYYYTKDAPDDWDGRSHGTIFRTRPDERFRRYVVVPAERAMLETRNAIRAFRTRLRGD